MAEKPKVLQNERRFPPAGTIAPDAMFDACTVRISGPSGLVGTAFGIPGVGATRIATGQYRVTIPRAPQTPSPAHVQRYFAQAVAPTGFQAPTGVGFNAQIAHRAPASGTFDLFTTKASPTGLGNVGQIPVNPPHNSEIDVWIFTTPITRY